MRRRGLSWVGETTQIWAGRSNRPSRCSNSEPRRRTDGRTNLNNRAAASGWLRVRGVVSGEPRPQAGFRRWFSTFTRLRIGGPTGRPQNRSTAASTGTVSTIWLRHAGGELLQRRQGWLRSKPLRLRPRSARVRAATRCRADEPSPAPAGPTSSRRSATAPRGPLRRGRRTAPRREARTSRSPGR